ncbi:Probable ATP-dependent RNA helicase DDX28 [Camponotus floridanus]|uniref:Probable ATP-dependent RNA helicase DDX28 n=1 Tax=Camponotus floridanus TaxID=104421 RepID=E2A9D0_CAMFO|nr:Probable ATP-dependent RNA helicase DDX28 [Camponotus floridanus]
MFLTSRVHACICGIIYIVIITMFSRFCKLCHKTANVQLVQLQRYHKRGTKRKSNVNRLEIPKNTEGKTPIIVYKRKELNFYEGQKYSKFEPIPLASKGWHHYKSKGDHFFIYPLTNLGFEQNVYNDTELPTAAQFALVSATMPSRMSTILNNIIDVQSLVQITSDKLHHILVPQKFVRVGPDDKPAELLKYIKPKVANREQVIIFSNTNSTCNWVSMFLEKCNIATVRMNGEMPLYDRQNKYASFKSAKCYVLCTTNAGSRGLDTVAIHHVLNYNFPIATADYIHRCGRTGRVDNVKDCRVTNFISTRAEVDVVQKIERAFRRMKPIPIFDNRDEAKEDDILNLSEIQDIDETNEQQEFSMPY